MGGAASPYKGECCGEWEYQYLRLQGVNLAKLVTPPRWKEQLLQRWLENAEYSVSLAWAVGESCSCGGWQKAGVNRTAQGVLVHAAVARLTSEGSEMEGERQNKWWNGRRWQQ